MEKLKYKSSDILISRIKENLSTYDSAGIIDSGKFYFYIKKELSLLDNYIYTEEIDVLEVINNKAKLPEDFIKLFNLSKIEEQKDNTHYETLRYNSKVHLLCDEDSPNFNSKSDKEFRIDDRYLYFNFKEGKVVLEYFAFPYDEDGLPLIPDVAKIEESIEAYIMFKVMEYFYINDITNNALQKMQYLEQKYNIAHKEALHYIKLPEYQSEIDRAYKEVKNRFKIFELNRKQNSSIYGNIANWNGKGQNNFTIKSTRI